LYRLSGRPVAERTMASTTQLFDVSAGTWSREVIRAAGDDPARWPTIVNPGTVLGPVLPDVLPAAARGARRGPLVVASCSHDTAAGPDAGAPAPSTRGEMCRLVLESLADGYRRRVDELEVLTGVRARVVHIVGGGARNRLLNQLTADACGRRVVAGPEEATALGNLLVQARALGDLPRGVAIRDVARASVTLSAFLPVPVPTR